MYRTIIFLLICTKLMGQGTIDPDSTTFEIDIDQFVITAQHEPTHYKKANHKVDIITKEQIRQRGVVTLDQALIINPAIRLGYDPVLGTTVRMRGVSGNNVAILIDGVPVIGRLDGNVDLSQINLQNIERIEIVEGALSNIYGSNAAGGVINLITNKTQISPFRIDLNSQIETIGQQSYNVNLGYKLGGFTCNVNGRYFNYNQFPVDSLRIVEEVEIDEDLYVLQSTYPFNPKKQKGVGGFLRYDMKDESALLLKYNYNNENVTDYGVIKRPQWNPYGEDRFYKTTRSEWSLNYKKSWDKSFLDVTTAYNSYTRFNANKRYYIETMTFDSLLQKVDTTQFSTYFSRGILSHDFSNKLKAITGLNYSHESGSGERIINRENPDSTIAKLVEIAPFFELKYKLSAKLDVMGSGRYMIHSIYTNRFTPSLLFKYTMDDRWIFRFGYAQGYRSPSLKEFYLEFIDINHNIIGNTNLSPELSHDFQFTTDYDSSKKLQLSLNIYHTTIKDRISLLEYETLKFRYENISEYQTFGIQPEISFTFGKNLKAKSSTSLSYWSTNIDSELAPTFGRVLDLNNFVEYTFSKAKFQFVLNHRHIGQQPIYQLINDEVQVSTIKGYELLDVSLTKAFFDNKLTIVTGVRNLLNITNTSVVRNSSSGGSHGVGGRNAVSVGRSGFISLSYSY